MNDRQLSTVMSVDEGDITEGESCSGLGFLFGTISEAWHRETRPGQSPVTFVS